jgi:riboflavin kinase/FMN adenylyltransferase
MTFDQDFASQAPGDFIRSLAEQCQPLRTICVGEDWAFGRQRIGNVEFLREKGEEMGFSVLAVPPVQIDGQTVSSTLIRRAVEAGEMDIAERFLGRPYTILGTVVRGKQLGRSIGFPTANLKAHNEQFPPNGVYAIRSRVESQWYRGVANIGVRPTVEKTSAGRLLEVHLFRFECDIYGQDIEVVFDRFLREERRFANLEDLKVQIVQDIQAAEDSK